MSHKRKSYGYGVGNDTLVETKENTTPSSLPKPSTQNLEIVKVQLIQRIQDEIARLEKTRTDTNPFLLSSDLKIQILNRLLQLILAPESFKSDVRHRYFGDKDPKDSTKLLDQQSSKTLSELITRLHNDETYCLIEGKIDKVKNEELINQKRGLGNSDNENFYKNLKNDFGTLEFFPPVIKNYTLHKNNKTEDQGTHLINLKKIHDQGKIFFEWKNEEFIFWVINKNGQEKKHSISKQELIQHFSNEDPSGKELYQHFREAANSSTPTPRLIPFLPDILAIASERGITHPPIERRTFTRIIYLGDSLTDKGQMYDSILGVWSGLLGTSPHKSFTNGPVWAVNVDNTMAIELLRKAVAQHLGIHYIDFDTCSQAQRDQIEETMLKVVDHVKNKHDNYKNHEYKDRFSLSDDNKFTIKDDNGREVVFSLTQAIGGLTAHSYFGKLSLNPKLTFTRLLLSTLDEQCNKLLEAEKNTPRPVRAQTVVHLLAGANDLVTVNERPTFEEADLAAQAIIDVMEKLYQEGFRQFDLSNLPNIGKTPRFLYQSRLEQLNAALVSEGLCRQLAAKAELFKNKHPNCELNIFNLHHLLEEGLSKPKEYGFSTEYQLVQTQQNQWDDLTTLANGCGFYRIKEPMLFKDLINEAAKKVDHVAYIRHGDTLYYAKKENNKFFLKPLLSTTDEIEKFDKQIKCADNVKSLPRNKWEKIKDLITTHNKNAHPFNPQFLPHQNKIYYQVQGETIQYRVMDPYDRVRQGKVTKAQLEEQANGYALLRSAKPPVTKDGKIDIDIPSGAAYVRYENELYYIYRISTDDKKQNYSFVNLTPVHLEDLDKFDADFKPWFASRQLTEKEKVSMEKRSLNWELYPSDSAYNKRLPISTKLNVEISNNLTNNYLPFIQAILADEDYVVARGDLYTPAQNTKAFQRVLDESGPIEPGDVVPVSNKAFNDLLHPIARFGGQWATRFFNVFLMRFHRFQPIIEHFNGLIDDIARSLNGKTASVSVSMIDNKNKKNSSGLMQSVDAGKNLTSSISAKTEEKAIQLDPSVLVLSFATAYAQKYAAENKARNFFSLFSTRKEPDLLEKWKDEPDNTQILRTIFHKADMDCPNIKSVLVDLGWIQKKKSSGPNLTDWAKNVPALLSAYNGRFNYQSPDKHQLK